MANFTIQTRFEPEIAQTAAALLELHGRADGLLRANAPRPAALRADAAEARRLVRAVADAYADAAAELVGDAPALDVSDGLMIWRGPSSTLAYPWAPEKLSFFAFLSTFGHAEWMRAKYTLPGVAEIADGDVVLDVGAFVGGFSLAAAGRAESVVAVEPSRRNRRALELNLAPHPHARIVPAGLGAVAGEMVFADSSTGVDSSFGPLDEGEVVERYPVRIERVDDHLAEVGVRYAKIEAEGAELQVLEGFGALRPRCIAIDGSPEGGGDDKPRLRAALAAMGYEVHQDVNMIYGTTA